MNLSLEHSAKKSDVRPARRAACSRSGEPRAFSRFRGAGALLATAMLLLAMAQGNVANADSLRDMSLRQWNAQWALISSSLASSLGANDGAVTQAQGEQLWHWIQSRSTSFASSQSFSAEQFVALVDEWQAAQRGQIALKKFVAGRKQQSSTRLCEHSFALALPRTQTASLPVNLQRFLAQALSSHQAARLSGVRTNRNHE